MRKFLLRAIVVLCVFGVPALASAARTPTAADTAKVAAILAQYPNGGRGLTDAIAQAVETDPGLASAVVAAALNAGPAVQQAIGAGLAQATLYFANACANPATGTVRRPDLCNGAGAAEAEQEIQAAMAGAPPGMLGAFNGNGGFAALTALLTSGETTLITQHCVSPSQPGAGC